MTMSMTGFAARRGLGAGFTWLWDLRSVNGKGLDLRLRLPDWVEGLEPLVRTALQGALGRGNVTLSLRLTRAEDAEAATGLALNARGLEHVLHALAEVERQAGARGVGLRLSSAAEIVALRGVFESHGAEDADVEALRALLLADLAPLLAEFCASRAGEGAALQRVIGGQIEQIAALCAEASAAAQARAPKARHALKDALARLGHALDGFDEVRVAQELALLAVKGDVTEELDRLATHIAAARGLLAESAPAGRRFDFLMQEFLREANTLLSKAQDADLTRIGLDLKTVIDQMREQVQNIE